MSKKSCGYRGDASNERETEPKDDGWSAYQKKLASPFGKRSILALVRALASFFGVVRSDLEVCEGKNDYSRGDDAVWARKH